MNKLNLAKLFKDVQVLASKHSPELLTGIGIAGTITMAVLAVKATPKALRCIDAKKKELGLEADEKLPVKETVRATWKCYIPAVTTGAVSIACLIGADSVHAKRNTALATAYNLSTTALAEYKDKVVETIGEKKEQVIREKVAEERLKKEPLNQSTVIVTDNGTTRFLDPVSKRRFTSDIEKIKRVANELNARMLEGEDHVSLNDFYYELGLEGIAFGDDLGWNVSKNGRAGMIKIDFSAHLDDDNKPSIVLDYLAEPKRGYDSYH